MPRSARRLGALALAAALVPAVGAMAHVSVVASEPASGAVLTAAPAAVSVTFDEELAVAGNTLTVNDASFAVVSDGLPTLSDDHKALSAGLLPGADGELTVQYTALDAVDQHPTTGSYTFTVEAGRDPRPSPLLWLLVAAVGAGLVVVWLRNRRSRAPAP